jgi:hypothetical protein
MAPEPDDDPVFDLVCHLVSAARGAPAEGVYTASLRLIHAAGKLAALHGDRSPFLRELAAAIEAESSAAYFASDQAYVAYLDRVVTEVATEVRRRNGLPTG